MELAGKALAATEELILSATCTTEFGTKLWSQWHSHDI